MNIKKFGVKKYLKLYKNMNKGDYILPIKIGDDIMSEICALEIMEKNDMIEVKDKSITYNISEEQYPFGFIKTIKLPYKIIKIKQKGRDFDKKFRELMQSSGYLCRPDSRWGESELFIKKDDVDEFIRKLPQKEIIYMPKMPGLVSLYIKETYENIFELETRTMYTGHGHHLFSDECEVIQIINKEIKKERIMNENQKEEKAIEFIKQLFK